MPHGAHSGRRDLLLALAGASLCRPGIGEIRDRRRSGLSSAAEATAPPGRDGRGSHRVLLLRLRSLLPVPAARDSLGREAATGCRFRSRAVLHRSAEMGAPRPCLLCAARIWRTRAARPRAVRRHSQEKIPLFDAGAITACRPHETASTPRHSTRFLHSASVRDQAGRAEQMGRDYGIVGIPTLVVNGQFAVRGPRVRGYDDILR